MKAGSELLTCTRNFKTERTANDVFWARSCLIGRAGATGNSRATLPFATMPEGREVGARNGQSPNAARAKVWPPSARDFLTSAAGPEMLLALA